MSQNQQTTKHMHGAIVGFGTIALGHLAAYSQMDDISIEAIVDCVPARRQAASELLPGVKVYSEVDDMFRNEVVDFIDICSPPYLHNDYIRAGLTNGCHVVCEKPLLLSGKEFGGILSLGRSTGKVLYPGHNYKFSPAFHLLRQVIASGQLGKILRGHFRTFRKGHALGVPQWRPDWRRCLPISGGGILRDHGTHSVYLSHILSGKVPLAVSCLCGNLNSDDNFLDTEDTALLTIDFGDFHWAIDLSWAANFRDTYYSVTGSMGNIIIQNDSVCLVKDGDKVHTENVVSSFDDPSHKSWFRSMFEDFQNVIVNPDRQLSLLFEALITALILDSAYLSARNKGDWIPVPQPSVDLML